MRKLILIGMAVAMLVVPAISSADVQRYQSQTATFTVTQPAGAEHQWDNLWTHDFTVSVNPCDGTFSGTGSVSGHDQNGTYAQQVPHDAGVADETITGSFGDNGSVTFTAKRTDGLVFSGVNVNDATVTIGSLNVQSPWVLELMATKPVITNTSTYKNHGEFVKAQADKNDAAHSCIGMPINSSK